jgi:RimJ/RimL family protein N-acetyltransferase
LVRRTKEDQVAMPGDRPAAGAPSGEEQPAENKEAGIDSGPVSAASSPLAAVSRPVRTARLLLRPATPDDLEASWAFRRLDAVVYWLTSGPRTLEEYRAVFEAPQRLAKLIIVELDGAVIGEVMATVEDGWAQAEVAEQARGTQAELGFVFDPGYAGHGYATEAVRELIRICFTELGLRRVTASCFAGNEASWRLMERVGMRRELYTVRDSLHRSAGWVDGMGYALLAEEWAGGHPEADQPS